MTDGLAKIHHLICLRRPKTLSRKGFWTPQSFQLSTFFKVFGNAKPFLQKGFCPPEATIAVNQGSPRTNFIDTLTKVFAQPRHPRWLLLKNE